VTAGIDFSIKAVLLSKDLRQVRSRASISSPGRFSKHEKGEFKKIIPEDSECRSPGLFNSLF